MFRFNLWGRGPFFHPGGSTPGLENPTPFPLPAHIAAHASMLGLTSNTADRALGLPEKDGKDSSPSQASTPLTSGYPMYRPGDPIPAGLYSPLHHQFLRAQLDLAAAAQSQAAARAAQQQQQHGEEGNVMHPASHFILNSHPSAFVPAAKRAKMDAVEREEGEIERRREEDHMSDHLSGPPTPVSPSSRHTVTPDRASGLDLTLDSSHRGSPVSNEPRSPMTSDGLYCPVCRCRLEAEEMDAHLAREMHELASMYRKYMENDPRKLPASHTMSPLAVPTKSRYETYLRIRGNREHRLSKLRGVRRKRMSEEMYNGVDSSAAHETSIEEEPIDIMNCDEKPESEVSPTIITPSSSSTPPKASPSSADAAPISTDAQTTESTRCNGCKEPFSKCSPLASTTCWHVYCSRCWETDQNCCPQCRQPVTPSDLHPIYL